MTRPYKNTPLQVAYDRKHEQLRKEVSFSEALHITDPFTSHACCCVGPQNGDPVCPCQMGQYIKDQSDKVELEAYRRMFWGSKPRVRVKARRAVV